MRSWYIPAALSALVVGLVAMTRTRKSAAAASTTPPKLRVDLLSSGPTPLKVGDVVAITPAVQGSGFKLNPQPSDMIAVVYGEPGAPMPPLVDMRLQIVKPGTFEITWGIDAAPRAVQIIATA